jgi:hypothetical protein
MRKTPVFLLILVGLVGLSGCASTPVPAEFGNFVQSPNAADDKAMAIDAVKKLTAAYPPARTRFNLQHTTPDAFGANLVTGLRASGYALAEVKPGMAALPTAAGDQALSYVVDQPLGAGLYRVTIQINKQTLSRVYQPESGVLTPAGAWVRKE